MALLQYLNDAKRTWSGDSACKKYITDGLAHSATMAGYYFYLMKNWTQYQAVVAEWLEL